MPVSTAWTPGTAFARSVCTTANRGVGVRTADVDHVQHAGLTHVGRVARAAANLQMAFDAVLGLGQSVGGCLVDDNHD